MRRFDKTKTIQRANLLAESRYLESKGLVRENYSVQNFVTDFHDAEFFTPFLQAIVKNGVDLRNTEDWNEIITMDRNQLRNTFGLTMGTAIKLYNALQSKIKTNDPNTVDGRAAGLKGFFKTQGTSGDYAEFKAMNNHFMNGGEIDNLEPKLKNIYMSKYKPFTKEEFMEIFKKVNN
jgi:hypothetical protein